jgi:hypothetical protein
MADLALYGFYLSNVVPSWTHCSTFISVNPELLAGVVHLTITRVHKGWHLRQLGGDETS